MQAIRPVRGERSGFQGAPVGGGAGTPLSLVIPGCATWRRPGIHTHDRGYGFRARAARAPKRRKRGWHTPSHFRDTFRPGHDRNFAPSELRGRREDRVRAAPAVSCASCTKTKEDAHEHTGSAETLRPSPRNGFTAYFALSLATGLSCHHHLTGLDPQDLTPASGRRDHTTSPSASTPFVKGASASTASHRTFVTIASRPSHRVRRAN
jgi:hypothetical protein